MKGLGLERQDDWSWREFGGGLGCWDHFRCSLGCAWVLLAVCVGGVSCSEGCCRGHECWRMGRGCLNGWRVSSRWGEK